MISYTGSAPSVWVVETLHHIDKRWVPMHAHPSREAAWNLASGCRLDYPGEKFRVTKYVSTKS